MGKIDIPVSTDKLSVESIAFLRLVELRYHSDLYIYTKGPGNFDQIQLEIEPESPSTSNQVQIANEPEAPCTSNPVQLAKETEASNDKPSDESDPYDTSANKAQEAGSELNELRR